MSSYIRIIYRKTLSPHLRNNTSTIVLASTSNRNWWWTNHSNQHRSGPASTVGH